jgi:cation diffusion facilitator CzcD-associated flavoprotein CzcO
MHSLIASGDGAVPVDYDAIIIGAGVAGLYQLHRLVEAGANVLAVDALSDVGGTWYQNRYPGCRFDSESYTYGYSFSKELLQEWDWSERFTAQPENLRYLNYVADKFELRKYIRFDTKVERAVFDEGQSIWRIEFAAGGQLSCRLLITALGHLSAPTLPRIPGIDSFAGPAFHTYHWPHEGLDLNGKRVGVVGTGATGVQVITSIAPVVEHLTVFQRRPNWCAPLNNAPISEEEMADIKARYDEIMSTCASTPSGFIHWPDRRPFFEVSREERLALWDRLYGEPGFGIWLGNFRDIVLDEAANAEFSTYMAERIKARVEDPRVAEVLIPTDHGFGVMRVPLESGYYETYNRDNVELIDVRSTPIEEVTPSGIRTSEREFALDCIIFATGFDAIIGPYNRIDIQGTGGRRLSEKWSDGPSTYLGLTSNGFPNLITIAGPQAASGSINYPRGIETCVNWITDLFQYMWKHNYIRVEPTLEAESQWVEDVSVAFQKMLMSKAKGWMTGYNPNAGRDEPTKTRLVYLGGQAKYRRIISEIAENDYEGMVFA